jgi:hypothetical protein
MRLTSEVRKGRWRAVAVSTAMVSIFGVALLASPAVAHQSGCHRWHSCPSDTGSYVCGDLGYDSQCATAGSTDPATARANLNKAQQRLATAQASVSNAAQQVALLRGPARAAHLVARRASARTHRAEVRWRGAENAMVDRRNAALGRVNDIQHGHADDMRTWRGNRAGAVTIAGMLVLAAVVALAWVPLSSVLAQRKRSGLTRRAFVRWIVLGSVLAAAVVAGVLLALDMLLASAVAMIAVAAAALLVAAGAALMWSSATLGGASVTEDRGETRSSTTRWRPALSAVLPLAFAGVVLGAGLAQAAPRAPFIDPHDRQLATLAWQDAAAHPTARVRRLTHRKHVLNRIGRQDQRTADHRERPLDNARADFSHWRDKEASARRSVAYWTKQTQNASSDGATPAPIPDTPAPSTSPHTGSGGTTPPRGPSGADGTYNCADFDTQQQAQDWLDAHGNTDGMDGDNDGVACQSLP